MKLAYLIGIAAGAGATLFLTSERGKNIIEEIKGNFTDLANKGIDLAKKTQGFGQGVQEVAREQYVG